MLRKVSNWHKNYSTKDSFFVTLFREGKDYDHHQGHACFVIKKNAWTIACPLYKERLKILKSKSCAY